MGYQVSYKGMDPVDADAKAIEDTKFYLGDKLWPTLMYDMGQTEAVGTAKAFQSMNMALGFCGVQGFPVHALGRTYMLKAYRAWMHSGDNPVMTDEKGYALPKEGA